MTSRRSKLEVHLHFHDRFLDLLPDELHLHFHAHPAPPVPGEDQQAAAAAVVRREAIPTPSPLRLGHTIYEPINETKVRANGSGPGVICCCGFAPHPDPQRGEDPSSVWAKVYDHDPGEVNTVPDDAVDAMVVKKGDPNYVFDHRIESNEVGGAQHSSAGVENFIRVWPVFGSEGVMQAQTRGFTGCTDHQTECQAGVVCTQILPRRMRASEAHASFPRRFRIQAGPAAGGPHTAEWAEFASRFDTLVERNDRDEGKGELTWTSDAGRCRCNDCVLWITQSGPRWQGTFLLRSIRETRLQVPLVYRCANWRPGAPNQLLLDPWHKLEDVAPSLIAAPA